MHGGSQPPRLQQQPCSSAQGKGCPCSAVSAKSSLTGEGTLPASGEAAKVNLMW